jgi:hypothetical protein
MLGFFGNGDFEMNFMKIISCALVATATIAACDPHVDTGRNSDPGAWPTGPTGQDQNTETSGMRATCFLSGPENFPDEIKTLCDSELRATEEFSSLVPILCDSGHLLNALDKPQCGWDGQTSASKLRFIHRYFTQKDKTKDYEDVTSSIIHTPVAMLTYTGMVRMAFENFDEFLRRGYQWASGTRENRKLSGTNWEDGVSYRFRADKDVYEVGYEGRIRYHQLTPTLGIHLNRAVGDFERIKKFAQIVLYSQLPDNTTLTIRLEHRQISSSGLFDLAKKSALELDYEAMEKGYANATKK